MSQAKTIDTKAIGSVTKHAAKLERERRKTIQYQELMLLARQVVASPAFQMIGTVAITEILESQGILSGRWAGAIEGGVVAMTGLQALKDYGVIGASTLGLGISAGSFIGDVLGDDSNLSDRDRGIKHGAQRGLSMGLSDMVRRYLEIDNTRQYD